MSLYLAVFGKPRYLGLVNIDEPAPSAGSWVVIKTGRGVEMALLGGFLSQEQEEKYRNACVYESSDEYTKGPEPMLQEVEFAGPADASQVSEHYVRRMDEDDVLVRSRQILRNHELQMKLVDVEYTMDRKKLFFYFTSEQRVDFRAYVRDLAKEFRIRIEMRQIGVRDEAKTVRGVSPCGRPCCCGYWLHRFTPINIRMVKEQNLALNPTKISGICGRLMCCMFYEHSNYTELWNSLPAPGTKLKTAEGNYVLEGVDLATESVRIHFPNGREVLVSVDEFANFKDTVLRGDAWEKSVPAEQAHRSPLASRPARLAPAEAKTEENPRNASRGSKKNKLEKISLDEHIAVRINEKSDKKEKKPAPAKTENAPFFEAHAKKRTRRRRNTGDAPSIPAKETQDAASKPPKPLRSGHNTPTGEERDATTRKTSRERRRRRPPQQPGGGSNS